MKNKLFSLILIAFLGMFSFLNSSFAAGTDTINGLDLTYIQDGVYVTRFSSYTLGTSGTYIYNKHGSTTSTAGSMFVEAYEQKLMGINVTNTDNATVTARLEFQVGTGTFWITPGVEITVQGTGTAQCNVVEPTTNLRWGIIKTGSTTGDVTITETYKRQSRR